MDPVDTYDLAIDQLSCTAVDNKHVLSSVRDEILIFVAEFAAARRFKTSEERSYNFYVVEVYNPKMTLLPGHEQWI